MPKYAEGRGLKESPENALQNWASPTNPRGTAKIKKGPVPPLDYGTDFSKDPFPDPMGFSPGNKRRK